MSYLKCVVVCLISLFALSSSQPIPNTSFVYMLGKNLRIPSGLIPNVTVYFVDAFGTTNVTVAQAKALNLTLVCYFSAGTYENWRPDVQNISTSLLGNENGWPGERYWNIMDPTVQQILVNRITMCKQKGFNIIDPDNVDAYQNNNGLNITAENQLWFNSWLADQAHAQGMYIDLKNDGDQIAQLVNKFDFAVNEECFAYNECNLYAPFLAANKTVFNIEYPQSWGSVGNYYAKVCPRAEKLGMISNYQDLQLDKFRYSCLKP